MRAAAASYISRSIHYRKKLSTIQMLWVTALRQPRGNWNSMRPVTPWWIKKDRKERRTNRAAYWNAEVIEGPACRYY